MRTEIGCGRPRMRTEYHEPRQILRLAAKSVLDPRAHARSAGDGRAGVHKGVGRIVVNRIGVHRTNHREIINVLGKMRKEHGHLRAALAEFFKRKLRPQTGELLVLQLRDRLPPRVRCRHRLAVQLPSSGLFASNVSKCDGPPDMYK